MTSSDLYVWEKLGDLLALVAGGLVLVALVVVIVIAGVFAGIEWLLRPLAYGERRRGIAPRARVGDALGGAGFTPYDSGDQRDPGDETAPREPHRLYCVVCGHGEIVPAWDFDLPPCPDCGGTRWSNRPDLPILGEPKEFMP